MVIFFQKKQRKYAATSSVFCSFLHFSEEFVGPALVPLIKAPPIKIPLEELKKKTTKKRIFSMASRVSLVLPVSLIIMQS